MPEAKLLLIGAGALTVVVVVVALWRARAGAGPMVVQTRATPELKGSLDAVAGRRVDVSVGREILHMLEAGRRAEAVALVRERTGWGTAEADATVARLEKLKKRLES